MKTSLNEALTQSLAEEDPEMFGYIRKEKVCIVIYLI